MQHDQETLERGIARFGDVDQDRGDGLGNLMRANRMRTMPSECGVIEEL
ncbi:hypothetical protein [Bosea sp. 685]|nr:hypothetical protein [Bosea sp. 685]WNJ89891.1 hypothetical protein RMR04_26450 [Bosea sp. 685]